MPVVTAVPSQCFTPVEFQKMSCEPAPPQCCRRRGKDPTLTGPGENAVSLSIAAYLRMSIGVGAALMRRSKSNVGLTRGGVNAELDQVRAKGRLVVRPVEVATFHRTLSDNAAHPSDWVSGTSR
jgi:hypothetical protein